jgi:hypothetical protein
MDAASVIDLLQWPAMLASLVAAWLTASPEQHKRNLGFWAYLISNVLWIVWGWHDGSYAVALLQIGLAALNIRGVYKTE